MNSLSRWNPFKSAGQFDPIANVDELFRTLARPWRDADLAPDLRIDVSEDDKTYHVKADLPGVDKQDIEISLERNRVSISAEIRRENRRKEGEKEIYTERSYGRLFRSFSLPGDVDATAASAQYEDGVLTLTLPKKDDGSARRISVS
ncbi:Hsp20/alpha crystallin family protein [Tahibacter caeni]|uniref:Hsp20/alpha crystallin family protein n=1 Tax=Tahibacter caeni TaxID=1453545 RepID=UPI0021474DB5|nr:Hsp20/alpha crystallin family protein [Tahibacter caeni]